MKTIKYLLIALLLFVFIGLESCGPVIVSSRPQEPMPVWFYPNRVVNVRYVYFPEYMIYYDITMRHYIYLENSVWITVSILPPRYNHINFRRAKQVRVNNYYGNNIREYHSKRVNIKVRRTSTNSKTRTKRRTPTTSKTRTRK